MQVEAKRSMRPWMWLTASSSSPSPKLSCTFLTVFVWLKGDVGHGGVDHQQAQVEDEVGGIPKPKLFFYGNGNTKLAVTEVFLWVCDDDWKW